MSTFFHHSSRTAADVSRSRFGCCRSCDGAFSLRSSDWTWFDLADESIAAAWQGLDVARTVSGVMQCVAQPLHGRVEAVLEIYERIVRPQALAKLVAGDQLTGAVQKGEEEPERLLCQNDVRAV